MQILYSSPPSIELTIHLCKENDSCLEPYVPIFPDRALPHALDLARQWLAACENKHSCRKQPSNGFIPDRLLEITDDSIKLRVKLQKAEPYVALSHCWGSTKPIVLSAENLDSFQEGLSWTDLPQTFEEAARVTQNLGYRFIWIDTLCIIQDSEEDWEEQSILMASIYGNAALVLAASAAKSTEDGFLRTKHDSRAEARLKLARNEHHRSIDRYFCIRLEEISSFSSRGPLDERAWAYQEEAVSRRYLAYAESGMEWSCTQNRYSEIGHYLPMREMGKPANLINLFNSCPDTDTLRAYWSTELVPSYKSRKLTVQSDILLALSAIAKEFHAKTKWTYLAGLWKEDLVRELAWCCSGNILPAPGPHRGTPQNKFEQKYCPSWSWASVDNDTLMTTEGYWHPSRRYFEAIATLVEAYTLPGSMSPFGLVHDGLVILRGPSAFVTFKLETSGRVRGYLSGISALLSDKTGICKTHPNAQLNFYQDAPLVRTSFVFNDNTVETSTRRRTSLDEEVPEDGPIDCEDKHTTNAWLIPLAMTGDDNHGFLECLVLGRVGTDPDRFQRLGLYTVACKKHAETDHCDFHELLGGMEIREFAIV